MRITCVEPTPFAEIPYLNALKGGRIEEVSLPLFRGQVTGFGNTVSLDRLKIGGVGGIVGSPTRLNRKAAALFQRLFERVLEGRPEVLICHEGPDFPRLRWRGNSALREWLELWAEVAEGGGAPLPLVVCGHCWWPEVMVELTGGVQVLKVDARAVVLTRASGS